MPELQSAKGATASSTQAEPSAEEYPCGMLRRMAAILYDGFLVFALLMVASLVVVALLRDAVNPNNLLFQVYLLVVGWSYFAICWRAGQTLGMMSWHIHIVGPTRPIGLRETAVRYLLAIVSWIALGLGFIWALFHPQRATWHDLASGTRLIVRPPRKKSGQKSGKKGPTSVESKPG